MGKKIENVPIKKLISRCTNGYYAIPFFQRDYVWQKNNITGFLDSLFRGWPTGAIIIWDTKNPGRSFGHLHEMPKIIRAPHGLVLDGQQRLTTLKLLKEVGYLDLNGDYGHTERYYFFFDLDTKKFVGSPEYEKKPTNFIDVQDVLNTTYKKKPYKENASKQWMRFFVSLQKICDYHLPVIHVEEKKAEKTIEIFNRVNTSGKKIEKVDVALAILKDRNYDVAKQIVKSQKTWARQGFDLNDRVILNSFLVRNNIHDKESYVTTRKPDDQIKRYLVGARGRDTQRIDKDWKKTKQRIEDAMDFLKSHGFDSTQFLASENTIVALVGYFEKNNLWLSGLSPQKKKTLRKWLYHTILTGKYSDTQKFRRDLEAVQDYGRFDLPKLKKLPTGKPEGVISIMYALGRVNKMKDYNGAPIAWVNTDTQGYKIQVDHIYPKSRLKKEPILDLIKKDGNLEENIGNKAFTTGKINPSKSDKFPGEKIRAKNIGQWIEKTTRFLNDKDYENMKRSEYGLRNNCRQIKKFIKDRQRQILKQIKKEVV